MGTASTNNYILAVDDTPDNLFLIQLALEQEGYQVQLANDGYSALDLIKNSPPDLILLDIMMPGLSGYEVTKKIREDRTLPFIPIILITAFDEMSMIEGLDSGADEFLRKPVKVDELQARVRALLRLKDTVEQRENFVSCLTHDLRTPLVAAERMLNLIQQGVFGEVTTDTHDAIDKVVSNNQHLLQMLNNLLEVHCYEVGQKNLSFINIDVSELVREVVDELSTLADEKGLDLKLKIDPDVSEIPGDRLEIRRVITNLIANAIKFTDKGFIEIRVKNAIADEKFIVIEVEDTGMGILPENQTQIFERFRKGNHKRSGFGLGLHLSRQIVQAHRGTIKVESEFGKGSVFILRLPTTRE
ncbi:MAG: ATP-binding response regulator [Xenococcaceae cyanobacterium]